MRIQIDKMKQVLDLLSAKFEKKFDPVEQLDEEYKKADACLAIQKKITKLSSLIEQQSSTLTKDPKIDVKMLSDKKEALEKEYEQTSVVTIRLLTQLVPILENLPQPLHRLRNYLIDHLKESFDVILPTTISNYNPPPATTQNFLQICLCVAAQKNDSKTLQLIFICNEKFRMNVDVNYASPRSGRTPFHYATNSKSVEAAAAFIRDFKVNQHQQDFDGFIAMELLNYPHQYNPVYVESQSDLTERRVYQEYIISEENVKLQERGKHDCKLIYIDNIREIDRYLKENPTKTRIGFIVKHPKSLTSSDFINRHVSPIYYERDAKGEETFIQFDSTTGQLYLMPDSISGKRRFIYSPFSRQVIQAGCFEDAVALLMKCLSCKNLVNFCVKHSVKNDSLSKPLTREEKQEANKLFIQSRKSENCDIKDFTKLEAHLKVARREGYQRQVRVLESLKMLPVKAIFELVCLPENFLIFVERYDTMRNLIEFYRQKYPQKVSGIVDNVLKDGGSKRNTSIPTEKIKAGLPKPDGDIKGVEVEKRVNEWPQARQDRHNHVVTFFRRELPKYQFPNQAIDLIEQYHTGLTHS